MIFFGSNRIFHKTLKEKLHIRYINQTLKYYTYIHMTNMYTYPNDEKTTSNRTTYLYITQNR